MAITDEVFDEILGRAQTSRCCWFAVEQLQKVFVLR